MKILFTTMALASGLLVAAAGTANAGSPAQCDAYARAQTDQVYPLGVGVLKGAGIGALAGLGIGAISGSKNLGKSVGIGAGVGAGVGTVAYQNKRQQYFNALYADCLNSGPPPPPVQPIYAPPPPTQTFGPPPYPSARATTALNVRSEPSSAYYNVITSLYAGQLVGVSGCSSSWCSIPLANGVIGYSSRSYLAFGP